MRKQKPKKPAEPGERSGLLILSPDIFAPDPTLHLFLLYNHSLVVYNVQSSPALEAWGSCFLTQRKAMCHVHDGPMINLDWMQSAMVCLNPSSALPPSLRRKLRSTEDRCPPTSLTLLVAVLPVDLMTPRIKLFPSYTSDLGLDGITSWGVCTVEEAGFWHVADVSQFWSLTYDQTELIVFSCSW